MFAGIPSHDGYFFEIRVTFRFRQVGDERVELIPVIQTIPRILRSALVQSPREIHLLIPDGIDRRHDHIVRVAVESRESFPVIHFEPSPQNFAIPNGIRKGHRRSTALTTSMRGRSSNILDISECVS